jgi:hypothetical protein
MLVSHWFLNHGMKNKTPPPEGDGVFALIVTRKEELLLSLAGLAATYSPRA